MLSNAFSAEDGTINSGAVVGRRGDVELETGSASLVRDTKAAADGFRLGGAATATS
jgi:hypothetical protein